MGSMLTKLKQFKDLRAQAKTMQSALSHETAHGSGAGGKVIAFGTPEELIKNKQSYTGEFLRPLLK